MRILSVITRYPPAVGGSETWCQEVCRSLARRGHTIKVLTLDVNHEEEYWREPLDEERTVAFGRFAFDEGVSVRRYRRSLPIYSVYHLLCRLLDRLFGILFYGPHSAEMYGRMWREIKKADVVILFTMPFPHNLVAFAVAKLLRKRIAAVPHFHPTHPDYERRVIYWVLRNCDAVLTLTDFEKEHLAAKGVASERLHVTGCGIHASEYRAPDLAAVRAELERRHRLEPDEPIVTFIGRKTPEKGVGHLIEAVRALIRERPMRLFLVGPGFDWYRALYEQLTPDEKERIVDLGTLSHEEKVGLLHVSDLLVLPSRYESFGIVFLEAWICGTPVVGTDEGAIPSVIGDAGTVCRFGDPDDLKAKIREALDDPEALCSRGARGREKALSRYTWDEVSRRAEAAIAAARPRGERVLIVSNAYPPRFIGGAELIAHAQAKVLKEKGCEVIVFAGELNERRARHSMRRSSHEGIPVYRVALHTQDYGADYLSFYHERVHELFDRLLEETAPDVVHFHNVSGLSASLTQATRRRRIKTVVTLHDYWGFCLKNTLIKEAGRICQDFTKCSECMPTITELPWTGIPIRLRTDFMALQLRAVDRFISPSAHLARTYAKAGIEEERIRTVWNGIDVDRFERISHRRDDAAAVRFSFIGFLGPHKGLRTLMDALPLLGPKERVRLNIVGQGEERAPCEQRVRELGWEGSVRFWGQLDSRRITGVYRQTDVLLLPSVWPENQPVSITEAMAARIPVIASRMGGIPELVEEGKTGYLFRAGDARELAQKMRVFLEDPGKLRELGENAFRKIAGATFDNQVEQVMEVYREEIPVTPRCTDDRLLVCVGKHFHPLYARALDRFLAESSQQWRVVMADWLEEEQLRRADALWVVDRDAGVADVLPGLRNKLPLVVPQESSELRALCTHGRCGLYYGSAAEAAGCLLHLAAEEETRAALGRNGFRLFYGG